MYTKLASLFSVLFVVITFSACAQKSNGIKENISAKELNDVIVNNPAIQLIDVRTPGEYQKGHIANALNLNWNHKEFGEQVKALDKNKPVYVYCLSGGRSTQAVNYLKDNGFTQIIEMKGGMLEWRNNQLPEEASAEKEKGMSVAAFEELVKNEKAVLVDFYAEWCAPCKRMKSYLESIDADESIGVKVIRIDIDKNNDLATHFAIEALPYLRFYKENKMVWEHNALLSEEDLRAKLK